MKNNTGISFYIIILTYLSVGASAYLKNIGSNSASHSVCEIALAGIICVATTILAGKETIINNPRTRLVIYVIVSIASLLVFSLFCLL